MNKRILNRLSIKALFTSILMCFIAIGVFAEGSLELNPDGGDRLYLYSGPSSTSSTSLPFPSQGLIRVYAKAGETIYLGSSAQGIGTGTIRWISPSGAINNDSGNSTTVGRINNRTEERVGPRVAGDASTNNGYNPVIISVTAAEEGVWSIFFMRPTGTGNDVSAANVSSFNGAQNGNTSYITAFDVSVRNSTNTAFIKGRAYLNAFAASMQAFNRTFSSTLYVQTYDGYKYEVKPNKMAGYIFNFFSNNKGVRNAAGDPSYMSANTSTGVNIHNPFDQDNASDVTHKIFFNNPSSDLPETAKGRRHTGDYPNSTTQEDIWLQKEPHSPIAEDLTFVGKEGTTNVAGSAPLGGYIYFKSNQIGSYFLNIDVNKNGLFNDPIDVILEGAAVAGDNRIYWDGRDGLGQPIHGTIRIEPSQTNLVLRGGEVHFPFVDVENNIGGMIIRRLNGSNPNDDTIYWDDSNITPNNAGVGPSSPVKTPIAGVSSSVNGHKWGTNGYDGSAFGNNKVLDTWAYIISKPIFAYMDVTFRESDLEVVSLTSTKNSYCVGEDIKYTVVIRNNGPDDVKGAKIFFQYPNEFLITGVSNTGGILNVENSGTSPYRANIELKNKEVITLEITGKLTGYINAGNLEVAAMVMRPKDHTDPDATNPDDAPPTDPVAECMGGNCNNIKTKSDITINRTSVSIYPSSVAEGSSGVVYMDFPVRLSQISNCDITVDYHIQHIETEDNDILSPLTGQLVIPANQAEALLKIQINPDKVIEDNERFRVIIDQVSGGNLIGLDRAEGTILDDDQGIIKITVVDGYEEEIVPGTKPAKFIFSFQNGVTSDKPVDISYLLSGTAEGNGIDYQGNTGVAGNPARITIPALQQSFELVLPVVDDSIVEGTEDIIIDVVSIGGGNRNKISLDNQVPTAKIFDNDEAVLTLGPLVSMQEGDAATKEYIFTVTLDKPTKYGFTVEYKTVDQEAKVSDNDYLYSGGFLSFQPNQGNQTLEVKVLVRGDNKIEANEKFKLVYSNLSNDFNGLLKFPVKETYGEIINDDFADIVLSKVDGKEGSKSVDFIFTLENGKTADQDIEIFYELDGAAKPGLDYVGTVTGSVIIPANKNSVTLELQAIADGIIEGDETVILTVQPAGVSSPYGIKMVNSTITAIIEDIDVGRVTITDVSESEGNNNTKYFDFKVTLDKKTQFPLDIIYSTQDGTALVSDNDYIPHLNRKLTFTDAGTQLIRVEVVGDMKIELDETFKVVLEQLSHTYGGNLVFGKKEGTGTLINDDFGNITITKSDGDEEGPLAGQFIFSFPQDITAGDDIRIPYNLSGSAGPGQDYTIAGSGAATGIFVFPKGMNSAILQLDVIDDEIVEGSENAVLNIDNGNIQSIYSGITVTNPNIALNIFDNDRGIITIIPPANENEGNESESHDYVYTLVLDKAVKSAFEVKYHTEDISATAGLDYVENKGQIKFLGNQANQSQTIAVRILGDNIIETDEQFRLILDEILGDLGGRITIAPISKATIATIIDDDFGSVSITSANGTEGGQNASFIFSLPAGIKADKDIVLDYSLSGTAMGGGVDYAAPMVGQVTIKAGDTQTILNISIVDDTIVEGNENVNLSASLHSGPAKITLANNTSALTIFDNDYGTISISSVSLPEGNTGTTDFVFNVKLDKQVKESFKLSYATQNGTAIAPKDYTAISSGELAFDGLPKTLTITVKVNGDKEVELDEQFFVKLLGLDKTFNDHLSIAISEATGTIINDDKPKIIIIPTDGNENGLIAGNFRFKFENDYVSSEPTVITYNLLGSATLGADYSDVNAGTITIPAGENYADVNLPILFDEIVEGVEDVIITAALDSALPGITLPVNTSKLDILDKDVAEILLTVDHSSIKEGDAATTPVTFTVTLTKATKTGFTLDYKTQDITAHAPEDYESNIGQIPFKGEEGEKYSIVVNVKGDLLLEQDELFKMALLNLSKNFEGRLTIAQSEQEVIIENDDSATISITHKDGIEGTQNGEFIFALSNGMSSDRDIILQYELEGTASSVTDYTTPKIGAVTLLAGQNMVVLPITLINDDVIEQDKTVTVKIISIVNPNSHAITFPDRVEALTIKDDDVGVITLTSPVSQDEKDSGETSVYFKAKLNKPIEKSVSVPYSFEDISAILNEDYKAQAGILTFPANITSGQELDIEAKIIGDKQVEINEQFNLVLSSLNETFGGRLTIQNTKATYTILDDDKSVINITAVDGAEGSLQKPRFRFEFTNGNTSDKPVVINYSLEGTAISPADYTVVTNSNVTTNTVTIPAGLTYVDLEFDVVDDDIVELTENISLKTVGINTTATAYSSLITLSNDRPIIQIRDNDAAEILLTGLDRIIEGNSGITKINYTFKLTKSTQDPFTIKLATADLLAKQSDNDYFFLPQDIAHSGNKDLELTATVDIIGDTKVEPDEDFLFRILGISNNYEGRLTIPRASIRTVIVNDDLAYVTITAKDGEEAPANNKPGIFTFSLPPGITVDKDLEIAYTLDGTAKSPADYMPVNGMVTLKKGDHSVDVQLDIVDDDIVEGNETVVLTATLRNASYGIQFKDNNNTASLKIIDNDYGLVSINNVQVQEQHAGEHTLYFNVSIDKEVSQPFKVYYHTEDGTAMAGEDYLAIAPSSISVGRQPADNNQIAVTYYGDKKVEADEIFRLALTGLEDLFGGHLTLDPAKSIGQATLLNDDQAKVKITVIHGREDGAVGKAIYKFTLVDGSGNEVKTDKPVTIKYELAGTAVATDYTVDNGITLTEITIPADQNSAELVFNIIDDEIVEGTETIVLNNLSVQSVYATEITLETTVPVLEIRDNDRATLIVISDPKILEGDSNEKDYVFTVKLDKATASGFTVNYKTQDITAAAGEDYVAEAGVLTFLGNKDEEKQVTVKIKGDHVVEPDEQFSLLFEDPSVDFFGRLTFPIKDITGTIENDDFTAIEVISQNGKEGGQNASFTIRLTNGKTVDEDLTIDYVLDNISAKLGADFTIDPSETSPLILKKGSNSVTLTLKVVDDDIVEETETVKITAQTKSNPRNNIVIGNPEVTLSIEDNDEATLSIQHVSKLEGDSNTTIFTFTVSLDKAIQKPFSVKYATTDNTAIAGEDYQAVTGTLNFGALLTAPQTQTFSVQVNGDKKIEPNEVFNVILSDLSIDFEGRLHLPALPGTGTIINDDKAIINITAVDGAEGSLQKPRFRFELTNGNTSDQPIVINYSLGGTSNLSADYTIITNSNVSANSVTIPAGSTYVDLEFEVIDDDIVELTENITLSVVSINVTATAYPSLITLSNNRPVIQIKDNDDAEIILTGLDRVIEGNSGITKINYTFKLTKSTQEPFTIKLATTDGLAKQSDNDYFFSPKDVLHSGDMTKELLVSVDIIGDTKRESHEDFIFNILGLSNNYEGRLTYPKASIQTIIENDDFADITITAKDGEETPANNKPGIFTFSLPPGITVDQDLEISYTLGGKAKSPADYAPVNGLAIIKKGDHSVDVQINIVDDEIVEGDETVMLTATLQNTPYGIQFKDNNNTATLKIIDNDYGLVSINNVQVQEQHSGDHTLTFNVSIDKEVESSFKVYYRTEDQTATAGEDYKAIPSSEISIGRLPTAANPISVTYYGDRKVEADEVFRLVLTGLEDLFGGHLTLDPAKQVGRATLLNDDEAQVKVAAIHGLEDGANGKAIYKFTLLDNLGNEVSSDKPVTISYDLGGTAVAADYTLSNSAHATQIVIPAGQSNAELVFNIIDDEIVEGTETIVLNNLSVHSAYANEITLNTSVPILEIRDNDRATLTVISAPRIIEGDSNEKDYLFTVKLDKATASGFTVNYKTQDITATADEDYVAEIGVLNFDGNKDEEKQVVVKIKGDHVVEPDETFYVLFENPSVDFSGRLTFPIKDITGIIENDDFTVIEIITQKGKEGAQNASFTFRLTNGKTVDEDLSIAYVLDNISAKLGEDFTIDATQESPLVIKKGSNSTTLTLMVNDDNLVEGTEEVTLTATVSSPKNSISLLSNKATLQIEDNDSAVISITSPTITEGNSGTKDLEFIVSVSQPTQEPFTVTYGTTDGTAKAGNDYIAQQNGILSFDKDNTSRKFSIKIIGDKVVEATEQFYVTLSNLSNDFQNHLTLPTQAATATIEDNDNAKISITGTNGKEEGPVNGQFIFRISDGYSSDEPFTINYVLGGEATAGEDYSNANIAGVTFGPGETEKALQIVVIDDDKVENDETVILTANLTSVYPQITLNNSTETIKIEDNDQALITLTGVNTVVEGKDGYRELVYTVTLNNSAATPFNIDYFTGDISAKVSDEDYLEAKGTLTFSGAKGQTRTFTVFVKGDEKVELDETFRVAIKAGSTGSLGGRLQIQGSPIVVTIKNDDEGQISITKIDGEETPDNSKPAQFVFNLNGNITSEKDITIPYNLSTNSAIGNGGDYIGALSGSVLIPAGQQSVALSLPVVDDEIVEGTETLTLSVVNPIFPTNITLANTHETLNIIDNDEAYISIDNVSVTEGNSGNTTMEFLVSVDKQTQDGFAISYETEDVSAFAGEDYMGVKDGTLTFNRLSTATLKIPVTVFGDTKVEADETLRLILKSLSNSYEGRLHLPAIPAVGTISNDDNVEIVITGTDAKEEGEVKGTFKFTLLNGVTVDKPVTIVYNLSGVAIGNGVDYNNLSGAGQLMILPGTHSETVYINVIDDNIIEDTEDVIIQAAIDGNPYPNNIVLRSDNHTIYIEDNDYGTLSINGPLNIEEGNSGSQILTFDVTLSNPTTRSFTVKYETEDGTATLDDNDYQYATGILSFNGQLANEVQLVPVAINGDTKVEGNEFFKVLLKELSETFGSRLRIVGSPAIANIIDDDNVTINKTISIKKQDGEEGLSDASFVFSYPPGVTLDTDTKIQFDLGGTATLNDDYSITGSVSSIVIEAGKNSATLRLKVIDDEIVEDIEQVDLTIIGAPINQKYPDVKMESNSSTLFIHDNDYGRITAQSRSIQEGDDQTQTLIFTLRLDKATAKDFKLKFHSEDGTAKTSDNDYIAVDDQVVFRGEANEIQRIEVRIVGDKKIEADEYFELFLTQLSNTFNGRLSVVNTTLRGMIENDDNTRIVVAKTDGEEGVSPVTFTFTLADGVTADEPILIDYAMTAESTAIGNGIDYIGATSGTVTIEPGDKSATLVLAVVDDELIEDDEAIVLKINAVRGSYTDQVVIPAETTTAYIRDNDYARLRILGPVEVVEGDVGTAEAKFKVVLDNDTGAPFSLSYRTLDGTATVADNDYIPKTGALNFGGAKGESKEIIILVNGDKRIEDDEDFFVELYGLSNHFSHRLIVEIDKARGVIIDDDNTEANKVINITKKDGAEGGNDVVFTFSFPKDIVSDYPTKIPYALSGTALGAGKDYTGDIFGEVVIPAGANQAVLTLPVINDDIVEDTETVLLKTGNVINENYGGIAVANPQIQANILDNDYGTIRIEDAQITEGDVAYKQLILDVILEKETGTPFTVIYNTEDGTAKVADNDYIGVDNGTLSFTGTAGEKQTISITILGDKKIEADEVFDVVLKALSKTFEGRLTIQKNRAYATLLNDDSAEITITAMDGAEAGTIPVRFKFSFPLGYTSDIPTVLNYTLGGMATAGGVDYKGSVTGGFAIPANAESAILELPVIDDEIIEEDETVSITINSVNTNYPSAVTVNPKLPVAKIVDNDFTVLTLSQPVMQKEGANGTTAYTFTLTLEKETGSNFIVKYSTEDGTATLADNDYRKAEGELSFAGRAGEVQTITVWVNGDLKIEADEDFKLKVFGLSNTFNSRLTIPVSETKNIILNDDSSLITVSKVDGTEGMQDGQFVFTLKPGVTSDKDIVIHYKLSGTAKTADYIASPSATNITIPAGKNSAVLDLKIVDDEILEETETVVLNVTRIDNPYNNVSMALPIPVLNIYDNDTGHLTIASPDPVVEGHSGTKIVTFTITLDRTTDKPFTVNYTTVDGTATVADKDYVKASGYLSFAGYAGETKKINVTIIGDTKYENDEAFGFKLMGLAPTFDGQLIIGLDAKGVILNDDFAPMAMDDYVTILEDQSVTFSVTANDKHDEGVDASTVQIITQPKIGKIELHKDGTVTYSPDQDVNGYDSFTYTVKDIFGRLSNEAIVHINIIPVNDAPVAIDDIYYVQRDSSIRENVGLNDYDVDGDVLTFRILELPKHGKIEFFDGMDGAFVYVPDIGFKGIDTFIYEVQDPEGLTDTAKVTLYVQPKVRVDLTPIVTAVTEGEVVKITAKLSEPLFQDVNMVLDFSGTAELNKDYTLEGNFDVIRIAAGDTVTTQYFLIKTLRDFIKEEDETVEAKIIAVDPSNFVTIGDSALVIIQDFYPEGKNPELNENAGIQPDPYMSPNGDGQGNEVFIIYNIEQYPDNEVVIYNRWGNEVFRIRGYNNKDVAFSGKANTGMFANKGEDLVDGVYFFIIHTKDASGKPLLNKGYVIMRR